MTDDFLKEKRRYPRIELTLDAKYKVLDYEQVFQFTKTQNISAEGVCFESRDLLKPGVFAQLDVDLKDNKSPISMVVEIRWAEGIKSDGGKKYINGVKVISMPAEDEIRFLKYYCGKMVDKLSAYLSSSQTKEG